VQESHAFFGRPRRTNENAENSIPQVQHSPDDGLDEKTPTNKGLRARVCTPCAVIWKYFSMRERVCALRFARDWETMGNEARR
jgi:hypothetical protein